jgi:3-phenylpropionate/trans-cinnamate dioxygenase ferredoxin reductase subunit
MVIVGAGTIGLELAASATQRGCQVTVELADGNGPRPAPVRDYLLIATSKPACGCCSTAPLNTPKRENLTLTLQNGENAQADAWFTASVSSRTMRWPRRRAGNGQRNMVDSACTTSDPAFSPPVMWR